jgi:hypothetical protein
MPVPKKQHTTATNPSVTKSPSPPSRDQVQESFHGLDPILDGCGKEMYCRKQTPFSMCR